MGWDFLLPPWAWLWDLSVLSSRSWVYLFKPLQGKDDGLLLEDWGSRSNWRKAAILLGGAGGEGWIVRRDSLCRWLITEIGRVGDRQQEPVLLWRDHGGQCPGPSDPHLVNVTLTHLISYSFPAGGRWESSNLPLLWAEEYTSLLYRTAKKGKWGLSPRGRNCSNQFNLGV